MSNELDLIGVAEAAQILNLSVRAVQHRIIRGDLLAQKMRGKTGAYVLNRADVEALAKAAA